jgi:hypothetical protein
MTIRFVLLVNKQGQTRLAQYYEYLTIDERRALEGEIVRKCLARSENQVSEAKIWFCVDVLLWIGWRYKCLEVLCSEFVLHLKRIENGDFGFRVSSAWDALFIPLLKNPFFLFSNSAHLWSTVITRSYTGGMPLCSSLLVLMEKR